MMHMLSSTRSVSCNAFGKDMRCNNKKVGPRLNDRTNRHRMDPVEILNKMNSRLNHSRQTFETDRIQTITDIVNTIAELSRQEMLLVHTVIEECITITFDTDKGSKSDSGDSITDIDKPISLGSNDGTERDTSN